MIAPGFAWVLPKTNVYAKPEGDEVIIFMDFFSVGLPAGPRRGGCFWPLWGFPASDDPQFVHPAQSISVVDEDLPHHADSGELRLSESRSLPTEDHCYSRLRWKIVGGGALVRVLYLRFLAERPQPCHHF